jgi:hypothetical protein
MLVELNQIYIYIYIIEQPYLSNNLMYMYTHVAPDRYMKNEKLGEEELGT